MPRSFNCLQASAWPIRNRTPSTAPVLHQELNFEQLPAFRARRASSSAKLEPSKTAVFRKRIGGLGMLVQSLERPRRNTNAPVNAANTIVVAASSTNRPMKEAPRRAPGPPEPPPSSHALSTSIPM